MSFARRCDAGHAVAVACRFAINWRFMLESPYESKVIITEKQVKQLNIEFGHARFVWNCPKCGAEHDRDINVAINILNTVRSVEINARGEWLSRGA